MTRDNEGALVDKKWCEKSIFSEKMTVQGRGQYSGKGKSFVWEEGEKKEGLEERKLIKEEHCKEAAVFSVIS